MRKILAVYDYGQGAVWIYLLADSADDVERQFPDLKVVDRPPEWMTKADLDRVRTVRIDDRDDDFLAKLRTAD
jgi:hypothetical protein